MGMGIEGIWPYSKTQALTDAMDFIKTYTYGQENFGFLKLCFPVEGKKTKHILHIWTLKRCYAEEKFGFTEVHRR